LVELSIPIPVEMHFSPLGIMHQGCPGIRLDALLLWRSKSTVARRQCCLNGAAHDAALWGTRAMDALPGFTKGLIREICGFAAMGARHRQNGLEEQGAMGIFITD